jgi:predicted transcriptional regulator
MSTLAAANHTPTAVRPDAPVAEAVTVMMMNGFSQRPVMQSERDIKGIVSWRSIGSRLALGQAPRTVRDVMVAHAELSADTSLFTAIPLIVEHEYVPVRASDQHIIGIGKASGSGRPSGVYPTARSRATD